jgi:hypothetical protein
MSKGAHSTLWILTLLLAVGCTGIGGAQLFLTAEFIIRKRAIDLFLSKRTRTIKAGLSTGIAAKEAENNA